MSEGRLTNSALQPDGKAPTGATDTSAPPLSDDQLRAQLPVDSAWVIQAQAFYQVFVAPKK